MLVRSCALQADKQSCFDNCLVTVLLSCVNMFHSAFRDKHHTCAIHSMYNMAIFLKVYWPKVLPLSIFCFPFEFVGFVVVFFITFQNSCKFFCLWMVFINIISKIIDHFVISMINQFFNFLSIIFMGKYTHFQILSENICECFQLTKFCLKSIIYLFTDRQWKDI